MDNYQDLYMRKRIADITFGLSSYDHGDPEDKGVDETERRIRRSLRKNRLDQSIWTDDGHSLIADPERVKYTHLFPFAVYEAKTGQKSETALKLRLKLAFNAYLKMLDRVVRQPGMVNEYQSPESREFQIFGFTSSGSAWRMYVGYLPNRVEDDPSAANDPLCDNDSVSCNLKLV